MPLYPEVAEAIEHNLPAMTAELEKLDDIEKAMTFKLSDLIREGAAVTEQAVGWSDGDALCALSAAYLAAKARHLL